MNTQSSSVYSYFYALWSGNIYKHTHTGACMHIHVDSCYHIVPANMHTCIFIMPSSCECKSVSVCALVYIVRTMNAIYNFILPQHIALFSINYLLFT